MLLGLLVPLLAAAPAPQPALERAVLAELNFARTQPQRYAERLRAYRRHFRGRIVYYPGRPAGLLTAEGTRAVDEAIAELERQAPRPPLAASPLLASAAADHVAEQGPRGAIGHVSRNGAVPGDRLRRRGGGSYVAEVITYGPPSAVEVVRQLIVDDGVPTRPNRKILFEKRYFRAGISCGSHPVARSVCAIDLSSFVGLAPDKKQAPNPPVIVEIR